MLRYLPGLEDVSFTLVPTPKTRRKGPPKSFESLREAKTALTNLADSLSTHSFSWPAAAIRSYLQGGSKSLDEAFGVPEPVEKKPAPKKKAAAKPASRRR
jgi:hypothetical protein